MKYWGLIFSLFFISTFALANEGEDLDQFYLQVFTGEHQTANYHGPLNPLTHFNNENGKLVFLDDIYNDKLFNRELQEEIFDLSNFWFNKLSGQSACPDSELGANLEYIRYLYRLTTISYLFESFKINHRVNIQLGGDRKNCALSFKEIFGQCNPQSNDMKKFKERVYGKFENEISQINHDALFKSEINGWLTLFKRSSADTVDPTFSRLHNWCIKTDKNCNNLTLPKIKEAVVEFCDQDRKLIQTLCN